MKTVPISTRDYHYLPGRFRVGVPAVRGNKAEADKLAQKLDHVAHIAGYINPVTGRILLVYNPKYISPHAVLKAVAHAAANGRTRGADFAVLVKDTYFGPSNGARNGRGRNGSQSKAAQAQKKPAAAWHSLHPERVLELTGTSKDEGLSSKLAQKRLALYGPNQLQEGTKRTVIEMLAESLGGFMPKLLLGAAAVSLFIGGTADALVITSIVILQAALETFQGYQAEKSLAALREMSAPMAKVVRDGALKEIPANSLVFGDLIQLEAGDRVPADARLLESNNLLTDESCLTGESIPVVKDLEIQQKLEMLTADKLNMLFAGTNITGGKAQAVVTATGMDTEMGKIASLLGETRRDFTFLHRQMESLGQRTTKLVLLSVGAIMLVGTLQQRPIIELMSTGVSLAVSAIPEGLPAVVTVALAFGVQRMAKRHAVVRRLSAVETLGGVTTICTDKTGTLTANEMTVKRIYTDDGFYTVTGEGYLPDGGFYRDNKEIDPMQHPGLNQLFLSGALCNNAELKENTAGRWSVLGDPTEGALLTLAKKGGVCLDSVLAQFERIDENVFDSTRRMMSVVTEDGAKQITVHSKGAPEAILERCETAFINGEIIPLDNTRKKAVLAAGQQMAGEALRVLALAAKTAPLDDENKEGDLTFLGLVGMADPPRFGVKEAISRAREAGIKVMMITGDHQTTAEAVGRELGLHDQGTTISGETLEAMSEERLAESINNIAIFARTSPGQKLRIVRALQKKGHIVAMTGDGINDAPAVKRANIGIAMGRSGTDVTREAAGITLSDDDFSTIVAGVEEGRTVAANIGKATRYVLPGNWGQVLAVFLTSAAGYATPLVPSQILWINLVTEGFPALALAADPPDPNCMKHPPHRPTRKLFSDDASRRLIYKAVLSGLSTFGLYAGGLNYLGWSGIKAQSMAFSHVVASRAFSIFDTQGAGTGKAKNPYTLPAAGLSAAMLLLTLYFPGLNAVFKTVPLTLADWGLLGISAGVLGRLDYWLQRKPTQQRLLPAP